jgi:hypothetical protein
MKRFVQNLEVRGFTPERKKIGRGFQGIRLENKEGPEPYWDR